MKLIQTITSNDFTSADLFNLLVNTVYCEELETLPVTREFSNLHLTDHFSEAIQSLNGLAGVYCVKCTLTGAMYIGSSMYLADRLKSHVLNSSNVHLRNAIKKYGLIHFSFIIVEFIEINADFLQEQIKATLLSREQHWLNWLFAQSSDIRYNFSPTAGSPLGEQHTEETKAKISKKGKTPVNKGTTLTEEQRKLSINASRHRYNTVYFYDEGNN